VSRAHPSSSNHMTLGIVRPLSQRRIAEELGMHPSQVLRYVRARDPARRRANERRLGFRSLIGLGLVQLVHVLDDGVREWDFVPTEAGKQALKEAQVKARTGEEE